MKQIAKLAVLILVFGMLFGGCSKVNHENYGKIKMGMTYEQVAEIIGDADACDEAIGVKQCIWGDDEKHISITFMGGKVTLPSMKGL